jgi:tryptophanyl-tRNA synthetase
MERRILSGMRPSGKLHIGHLFGVLENWKNLQRDYSCFFEVADWHALTTEYDKTEHLKEYIFDMVVDWLTVGIDPDSAVIFVQSDVKTHAELHLLFSMLVSLSRLLRNPTFKEYVADLKTQELTQSGKRILERASDNTISAFLELTKDWEKEKFLRRESRDILKAKFKDIFIEELGSSFMGTEEELSYGHLVNYGFLGYPVLQAADILIYRAQFVPVGEDQLPHLELTREIARRFNSLYGEVFPVPEPLLTKYPRVPGTDGKRMSKSRGNTILISEPSESLREKVKRMFTDPEKIRKNDPGHPEICPVFSFHGIFNEEGVPAVKEECEKGLRGCVDCKGEVAEKMDAFLEPLRVKRREFEKAPDLVYDILREGGKRAREEADITMTKVRKAMKMFEIS